MAGQPKRRTIIAELERRTRARFDENEGEGRTILDYVVDWIESGGTLIALAKELEAKLRIPIERAVIPNLLRNMFGDTESDTRLANARTRASHVLAEESVTLLDEPADNMVDVTRARDRSKSRQWLASTWNRDTYGSTKGNNVTISIGSLHLDALRARQAAPAMTASAATSVTMLPTAKASNETTVAPEDVQVIEH
jgi:hypothetical protein